MQVEVGLNAHNVFYITLSVQLKLVRFYIEMSECDENELLLREEKETTIDIFTAFLAEPHLLRKR